MTEKLKAKLGDLAKDKITEFKGIVVARTEWLNGCVRIGIQPQEMKDGKPIDSQSFDVEQVEVVEEGAYASKKPRGGPMPDQKRPADPQR